MTVEVEIKAQRTSIYSLYILFHISNLALVSNMYKCTQHCQTKQVFVDWQFWQILYSPFTFVHICFFFVNSKCTFFHVTETQKMSVLPPPRLSYELYSNSGWGDIGFEFSHQRKKNPISSHQQCSHAHPRNLFQYISSALIILFYRWQEHNWII